MEFVSVEISCETEGCPSNGVAANTLLKLTDDGKLPRFVCGVCQVDLIPDPMENTDEPA